MKGDVDSKVPDLVDRMRAIQTLAEGGKNMPWNTHQGVFDAIARIARAALKEHDHAG